MPHAGHFLERLERLDRVSDAHVELALRLYRDRELLTTVFERARVPDSAGRVALSLEHDTEGPFVVVTRAGAFVTCLARGMSPRPHSVVTRAVRDTSARRMEKLREAIAISATVDDSGNRRGHSIWARMTRDGANLPREVFAQLGAVQSLMRTDLVRCFTRLLALLDRSRATFVQIRKFDERHSAGRRLFWNAYHALGHVVLLLGMTGPKLIDAYPDGPKVLRAISMFTTGLGMRWPAVRAAWTTAKIGKPVLAEHKAAFANARSLFAVVDSGNALLTLAIRHARMRAEIEKALRTHRRPIDAPRGESRLDDVRSVYAGLLSETLDPAAGFLELHEAHGRALAFDWTQQSLPVWHSHRYASPEAVPSEIAMWWLPNVHCGYVRNSSDLVGLLSCLPWVARARAEDFYLPETDTNALHSKWEPSDSIMLLDELRSEAKPAPHVANDTPGRNEPCTCGSGKKFKKCCAS